MLLTTDLAAGAQQLIGVVLLAAFVATVSWAHARLRWHILLADLAGIAVYVAGSWALLRAGPGCPSPRFSPPPSRSGRSR